MWTPDVHSIVLMGFVGLSGAMAAWRDAPQNERPVRDVRRAIERALQIADLSHKEACQVLDTPGQDYSQAQWSQDLARGGNLTALVLIGLRHPVFGAALANRLSALLRGGIEARVARTEQLLAEFHELSREEATECEVPGFDSPAG